MPDVVLGDELAIAGELLVEPSEGRALIAGDHRGGVEAGAAVGAMLVEREPYEPLHAGEENPALVERVLVRQGDLVPHPARRAPVGGAAAAPALGTRFPAGMAANCGGRHAAPFSSGRGMGK